MAQRVATEYVNASIQVTEAEMPILMSLCEAQQLRLQVFVLDNGNHEVVLQDEAGGEAIRLTFERIHGHYVCVLSCRVEQLKLTNVLRKLISAFKGDAVVNRIYQGFTMVYHYLEGKVIRIVEVKGDQHKTVFEHRDTIGRMEAQFRRQTVEEEIGILRRAVNELLDLRNQTSAAAEIADIDERLQHHSRLLFALEA
ncbi:non-ribosomal peptide synthetase module [Cohnella lubricantis]|uniref:Non-ribosomal peptide synthetase module n=1 Tax=Cohnella lubricantis TaxID=2163172 RepID=A0A841TED3_9BACL|nr:non-ribosomal peptide synthetase module [Cohnella lubricantis]MBB6677590.1 non-ribosomal peptide synthetase module [Cohnella lubricantis]MBP2116523.1 hypothetical protein [Cohnella lubricantis]